MNRIDRILPMIVIRRMDRHSIAKELGLNYRTLNSFTARYYNRIGRYLYAKVPVKTVAERCHCSPVTVELFKESLRRTTQ